MMIERVFRILTVTSYLMFLLVFSTTIFVQEILTGSMLQQALLLE